jgi:demethylmenaquinone methyltransferase/2-methoxy-6-polyprenyl-1,4-benzoquinol methylase
VTTGQATRPPLPQGKAKQAFVQTLFDRIAPRYALVNKVMTLGLDMRWRRKAIRLLGLAPGSVVADLACGPGEMTGLLSAGGVRAAGFDLSWGMLAASPHRLPLAQADAALLPLAPGALDGAVSAFALRNFADLEGVLHECGQAIRPGGRVSFLDVGTPANPVMRTVGHFFLNVVAPVVGGLVSDSEAYRYLPRSVVYLPAPVELLGMLERAGFTDARHHPVTGGIVQVYTATRGPSPLGAPGPGRSGR